MKMQRKYDNYQQEASDKQAEGNSEENGEWCYCDGDNDYGDGGK